MSGYKLQGDVKEALRIFYQMEESACLKPNEGTFVSVLNDIMCLGTLDSGLLADFMGMLMWQKKLLNLSSSWSHKKKMWTPLLAFSGGWTIHLIDLENDVIVLSF